MAVIDETSDEDLLKAIVEGEIEAMEQLYQRYSRTLYSIAMHMVADQQVAEDLVQDALVSVWRHANSYSPHSGTARSWIVSILHHRAIDYLRTVQRRSGMREAPLGEAEYDEKVASPDAWESVWRSVQSTQVRAALMRLPPEQRLVIELAYFHGWTHAEIAQGIHVPLGTVKARMRLGMMHLKRALMQMGINEA